MLAAQISQKRNEVLESSIRLLDHQVQVKKSDRKGLVDWIGTRYIRRLSNTAGSSGVGYHQRPEVNTKTVSSSLSSRKSSRVRRLLRVQRWESRGVVPRWSMVRADDLASLSSIFRL